MKYSLYGRAHHIDIWRKMDKKGFYRRRVPTYSMDDILTISPLDIVFWDEVKCVDENNMIVYLKINKNGRKIELLEAEMRNAEFVNKVLFTGHIDVGSIYADLMTFIYNDPCPDARLKQLVINRNMDGIFNYAKEKGEYK